MSTGRVSYHFGLKGPSMAVDTACSSALVALDSARGHTQDAYASALVGGINMMLLASTSEMFRKVAPIAYLSSTNNTSIGIFVSLVPTSSSSNHIFLLVEPQLSMLKCINKVTWSRCKYL